MMDMIGDIHGHADELEELLAKLGYTKTGGAYTHPDRKVLFVGDYIDRGPKNKETLEIVKAMVDEGSAIALMGNHEYNAICFHLRDSKGGHCRPHSIKNIKQHFKTLDQFHHRQKEYDAYIDWFLTLPLFYEAETFRAVHACWVDDNIAYLRERLTDNKLNEELVRESLVPDTPLYNAIDQTLKGKELRLPAGKSFNDKDGNERRDFRIKWWENPDRMTYKSIAVEPIAVLPDDPVATETAGLGGHYPEDEKRVFFGHYWLKDKPRLYRSNICCLDYSVAKEGVLAAYRYDGEDALSDDKFEHVAAKPKNTKTDGEAPGIH